MKSGARIIKQVRVLAPNAQISRSGRIERTKRVFSFDDAADRKVRNSNLTDCKYDVVFRCVFIPSAAIAGFPNEGHTLSHRVAIVITAERDGRSFVRFDTYISACLPPAYLCSSAASFIRARVNHNKFDLSS